jgi:hypothetical protein
MRFAFLPGYNFKYENSHISLVPKEKSKEESEEYEPSLGLEDDLEDALKFDGGVPEVPEIFQSDSEEYNRIVKEYENLTVNEPSQLVYIDKIFLGDLLFLYANKTKDDELAEEVEDGDLNDTDYSNIMLNPTRTLRSSVNQNRKDLTRDTFMMVLNKKNF